MKHNLALFEFSTRSFKNFKKMSVYYDYDDTAIDSIASEIFEGNFYRPLVDYCKDIKEPVILDIGAHVGMTSMYFAEYMPNAKIYAIEPNPYNVQCLEMNIKKYPNIRMAKAAITGIPRMCNIGAIDDDVKSDSIYYDKGEKIAVEGITIQTLMEQLKLKHIDGMKIDVEGAEYEIFMMPGFTNVSKDVDYIIGESHHIQSIPEMIPAILGDTYDVSFLPYNNMTMNYGIFYKGQKYVKMTSLQTMFEAKRKKP